LVYFCNFALSLLRYSKFFNNISYSFEFQKYRTRECESDGERQKSQYRSDLSLMHKHLTRVELTDIAPLWALESAKLTNTRLECNLLTVIIALAYPDKLLLTGVKSFMLQPPGPKNCSKTQISNAQNVSNIYRHF
jgi:hypothetical protein